MKISLKLRICIIMLILVATTATVFAAPYKADAKTKRIPAGTKLQFKLLDPINTLACYEGYPFSAMLIDEQVAGTSVILPVGSIVRGSVRKIKPKKMLSRGAVLYLDFDHIVTPNGRQLPLSMTLHNRDNLTYDGGIYGSKGYGEALQQNWAKTVEITKTSTQFGIDIGEDAFTGANYITVPVCATGGAFGGGVYFVGDSIIDLFRKGQDVILQKGDILNVILAYPIDVPVN